MPPTKPPTKQITVKIPLADLEELANVAQRNNLTLAGQIRKYIAKGISVDAYQRDEEQILTNMKAALKEVLSPQTERLAKINVKNAVSASFNMLLSSLLLNRLCAPESRPQLTASIEAARRYAIGFVSQQKGSIEDFLQSSMEKLNGMWGS